MVQSVNMITILTFRTQNYALTLQQNVNRNEFFENPSTNVIVGNINIFNPNILKNMKKQKEMLNNIANILRNKWIQVWLLGDGGVKLNPEYLTTKYLEIVTDLCLRSI